jgi:ParG
MTKKVTVRQPTERAAATDDWVSGAATVERRPATPRTRTEKPARLTIDLPPKLHGRFKAACANNRTKMKDEVLRFIEQWTQKNGNT